MPNSVIEAERDDEGVITSLHLSRCQAGNATPLVQWIESQTLELQSLTIESCGDSDVVAAAIGNLASLRMLRVWNSPGWLSRLAGNAKRVEIVEVSDSSFNGEAFNALRRFKSIRNLTLIAKTEELELRDIEFDNLEFLGNTSIERLEVVARSVAVRGYSASEKVRSLRSVTIIADARPADIQALTGISPVQSLTWVRVVDEECETPLSAEFTGSWNWSDLRAIRISINPVTTWAEWRESCGIDCPDAIKITLGASFAESLQRAPRVRKVTLQHVTLEEEVWDVLANLSHLESIEFDCCDMNDTHLRRFLRSSSLSYLRIGRGRLSVSSSTRAELEEVVDTVVWP